MYMYTPSGSLSVWTSAPQSQTTMSQRNLEDRPVDMSSKF